MHGPALAEKIVCETPLNDLALENCRRSQNEILKWVLPFCRFGQHVFAGGEQIVQVLFGHDPIDVLIQISVRQIYRVQHASFSQPSTWPSASSAPRRSPCERPPRAYGVCERRILS